MEWRIVRVVDGYWRVSLPEGDMSLKELAELKDYLEEIRYPFTIDELGVAIDEGVPWDSIHERMSHFYDGIAEVVPF